MGYTVEEARAAVAMTALDAKRSAETRVREQRHRCEQRIGEAPLDNSW